MKGMAAAGDQIEVAVKLRHEGIPYNSGGLFILGATQEFVGLFHFTIGFSSTNL